MFKKMEDGLDMHADLLQLLNNLEAFNITVVPVQYSTVQYSIPGTLYSQ